MPKHDEQTYFVIPLSVQPEGDGYYIGNAELNEFYEFPEDGLRIIQMLRKGDSAEQIKAALAAQSDETLDVDDFIEQLVEIGFIHRQQDQHRYDEQLAESTAGDKRLSFKGNLALARALFSPLSLAIYLGVIGYAALSAYQDPRLRLNLQAFYLEQHLTLTLVTLLVLYFLATMLHELGHMMAAARYGVHSRLGIGNRLWDLVAEADLTGILSLPRSQRYLPLMAGMMVDVLNIALLTLAIGWLIDHSGNAFLIQLLQALILQLLITISWQFNIFLRTDMYYVVCNFFGNPDLDRQARIYLRDRMHRISFGRFGEAAEAIDHRNIGVLRAFSLLWVIGRISALIFLAFVLIPTLSRYVRKAYDSFASPQATQATAMDAAGFAAISVALFAGGMYLWLRRR
ncbi:PqqD family protein [Lysobacter gummosus]|jgi:putative peptide zinc metalloprotease protein|uniref:PqqD family protein n=1 Tax=Lysobacter gummosus TaxID=262324 RepID=A0ABY3X6Z4_9GAMM|nr:PqqD family protein [Lysobacter gummosus]ALN92803.1 hypothetical protein LG3211_3866 [Lysobacter gummosus]UNP28349.1 PqqD family protein [Lysobacter gummosus]